MVDENKTSAAKPKAEPATAFVSWSEFERLQGLYAGHEKRLAQLEEWRHKIVRENEPGVLTSGVLPDGDLPLFRYELRHQPGMNVEDSRLVTAQKVEYDKIKAADNGKALACLIRTGKAARLTVLLVAMDERFRRAGTGLLGIKAVTPPTPTESEDEAQANGAKPKQPDWPPRCRLLDWELFAENVSAMFGERVRPGGLYRLVKSLLELRALAVLNGQLIVNEHLHLDTLSRSGDVG